MDFLVMYCERWETPLRTSKHHYIKRLAADGHRILYVEVPANPMSAFRRFDEFKSQVLPRLRAGVEAVSDNIWIMTGFVPLPYHPALGGIFDWRWINQINQHMLLPNIKSVQEKLGFQAPFLLSYYPLALPIINKLGVSRTAFHMVDEWQGMKGIPRSMATLTQEMLKRADVTIVTSARLFERYRFSANRIELLRHGADLSLFGPVATGDVTPDSRVKALPGLKVGYYGALHKLDAELIIRTAQARPDWSFVFVGPVLGGQGIIQTEAYPPNVYFLGDAPLETLPKFLAALDTFWMPFAVNELTQSMCPIKMFEVMSAGVPLVSTDLEECRAVAGEHALFATDLESHIVKLERAVDMHSYEEKKRRTEAVRDYDWNNRYSDFVRLLRLQS
jgi:glycosyltransferase involved in cell wall biosynthesis